MTTEDFIVTFPKALPGFPGLGAFRLHEPEGGYPLKFLQSLDHPEISFACVDAATVRMDFEVPLGPEDSAALALESPEDALVLTIVVVPEDDPRRMTANLAGPLVINSRTRIGRQIELDSRTYPLAYPVFLGKEGAGIHFPNGLIGFPDLHFFNILEPSDSYPLKFLQPLDRDDVSFICIDVAAIKPDYEVTLNDEDAQALAIKTPADAMVLALVVIPEDPRQMTANLAGPLLINLKTRKGRQIVLNTEHNPLKYPVFTDK